MLALTTATCASLSVGCAGQSDSPTPRPVATDVDPEQATADYWLNRPAVASVTSRHYEHLFNACDHVLRQRYFGINRSDFRNGVLISEPLISKQIWEFWRQDVGSFLQQLNSTLATYRRTVHWTITAEEDGEFVATPKVVVERYSATPRRITAVTRYTSAASSADADAPIQSPSLQQVKRSPWYAVGRDEALERQLAEHAERWMRGN